MGLGWVQVLPVMMQLNLCKLLGDVSLDKLVPSHSPAVQHWVNAALFQLVGCHRPVVYDYGRSIQGACQCKPLLSAGAGRVSTVDVAYVARSGVAIAYPHTTTIADHIEIVPTPVQVHSERIIASVTWLQRKSKTAIPLYSNLERVVAIISTSHQPLAIACAMQVDKEVAHQ